MVRKLPDMFERFTDRARRVLVLAQDEARALEHDFLGTEHLLLGLIKEGEGVGYVALTELGLTHDRLRAKITEVITPGAPGTASGAPPFTPRSKQVLELSMKEALQLGHNYIGTEHLLLGLIAEGSGFAGQLLVRMGVDLARARGAVMNLLIARGDVDGLSPDRVPPSDEPAELVRVIPLVRAEQVPPQSFTLIALDLWTSFIEFRYALSIGPRQSGDAFTM